MPPALAFFRRSLPALSPGIRHRLGVGALAVLHLAALAILLHTEEDLVSQVAFLLGWGLLNFLWLALLGRPAAAASLSLLMIAVLILLSQFKQDIVFMTASFVDLMLIDFDTFSFLLKVYPHLQAKVALAAAVLVPLLLLLWWSDPLRVRFRTALAGAAACFVGLAALSYAMPLDRDKAFEAVNYVSQFARSGSVAAVDLATKGLLESDSAVAEQLAPQASCTPERRLPHIFLVLDESSFDISAVPGVKVPANYQSHFRSADGEQRTLLVEGAGGPTWYTEYNVLSGLSTRSYGHFADFVTRIANGRVSRSLPNALRNCGYRTYSIYPWLGAFLSARGFQTTLGIEHFLDAKDLKTQEIEPDEFYYDYAANLLKRDHAKGPLFIFTYLLANHFPWSYRYRDEMVLDWQDLGNRVVDGHRVDEYLRRQEMSARDYKAFIERLKREFPNEPILVIRFGDHQPLFAKKIVVPGLDDASIGRRIDAADPRYFTTYYAIDAVNFEPADLGSAVSSLDAAYLPLVVLETAGVPLDTTFAEQKRIFQRCHGLFYLCNSGAEARRFNRLLINAGLIKRL